MHDYDAELGCGQLSPGEIYRPCAVAGCWQRSGLQRAKWALYDLPDSEFDCPPAVLRSEAVGLTGRRISRVAGDRWGSGGSSRGSASIGFMLAAPDVSPPSATLSHTPMLYSSEHKGRWMVQTPLAFTLVVATAGDRLSRWQLWLHCHSCPCDPRSSPLEQHTTAVRLGFTFPCRRDSTVTIYLARIHTCSSTAETPPDGFCNLCLKSQR